MKTLAGLAIPTLYAILAFVVIYNSIKNPTHNYDLLPYIGAAIHYEEKDPVAAHAFTFGEAKKGVSESRVKDLITNENTPTPIRETMAKDPECFMERLCFWEMRVAYTGLIYLLYKAGVNIVFATHIITGIAIAAAGLILYLLARKQLLKPLVIAVPLVAVVCGAVEGARYSNPVGLVFFSVVLSAYFCLNRRIIPLLITLPIMLTIRADLILYTLPLLLILFIFHKQWRLGIALSTAASFAVYFGLTAYTHHPGWGTLFYNTFVGKVTHPLTAPPQMTPRYYLQGLTFGIKQMCRDVPFAFYALVNIQFGMFILPRINVRSFNAPIFRMPAFAIAAACLVYTLTHFIAHPTTEWRFFLGQYVVGIVALFAIVTDYAKSDTLHRKHQDAMQSQLESLPPMVSKKILNAANTYSLDQINAKSREADTRLGVRTRPQSVNPQ